MGFLILCIFSQFSFYAKKPLVLPIHKDVLFVVSMRYFSKKFIEFLFWLDILLAQIQKNNTSRWGFPRECIVGIPIIPCISKAC